MVMREWMKIGGEWGEYQYVWKSFCAVLIKWVWLPYTQVCICIYSVCVWLRGAMSLTTELFNFAASEERKVLQVFHTGISRFLVPLITLPHMSVSSIQTQHVIRKASFHVCVCVITHYNALRRNLILCCSSCLMICIPTLWGGRSFNGSALILKHSLHRNHW